MESVRSSPRSPNEKAASLLAEQRLQRMQKVLETDEKMRVHHHNKIENSSKAFANTKVTSCSGVLMTNGMSICIPFRSPSNGNVVKRRQEKLISMTQ
jgi:hypothetical protein